MAQKHRPRVVLMDVRLRGESDGVSAALAIHEHVGSKVIFITGSKEEFDARTHSPGSSRGDTLQTSLGSGIQSHGQSCDAGLT